MSKRNNNDTKLVDPDSKIHNRGVASKTIKYTGNPLKDDEGNELGSGWYNISEFSEVPGEEYAIVHGLTKSKKALNNLTIDELTEEQFAIIDGYVDGNDPVLDVIGKLGCSSATFYQFLKRNGIDKRKSVVEN